MPSPTRHYTDKNGYGYVELEDWWKNACLGLPSFANEQWPDYATKAIDQKIRGNDVVVQLWVGWCQKFLGLETFPGGIGAEVGIYRRIPGKTLLVDASLGFLPPPLQTILSTIEGGDLWWPYPELGTELTFELVNPTTGKTFFTAGPEKTFWLNKWMDTDSYEKYKKSQDERVPFLSASYNLKYTIDGVSHEWSS
jgi:hypothetical protein